MCKPASFYVTPSNVYWSKTSDSHTEIIREFGLREDDSRNAPLGVRVEISPANDNLSLPLADWVYKVDQDTTPSWYDAGETENKCRRALNDWAAHKLSKINLTEAYNPINPLLVKRPSTMTKARAVALCKKWASVRNSVWNSVGASVRNSVGVSVWDSVRGSVWNSVWDSVRGSVWDSVRGSVGVSVWNSVGVSVWDSVWGSVGAYTGSLFTLPSWSYAEKLGPTPWAPLRELWVNGLVPSFDGTTWRLHQGPKAEVFVEFKA